MSPVLRCRSAIAVAVCLAAGLLRVEAQDYCSICSDQTLCIYQGDGQDCTEVLGSGVSDADIATIVDQHNMYRSTVASGSEQRGNPGPQPSAANMRKLTWDSEIAAVAQRWADQCTFGHDSCRNVDRFYVGQNVFETYTTGSICGPNWSAAVQGWYDEVQAFDGGSVDNYQFSEATGHYTQVAWADTETIGCGYKAFRDSSGQNVQLYVCDYGPGGNFIGQPVYQTGDPCSQCSAGCDGALCA